MPRPLLLLLAIMLTMHLLMGIAMISHLLTHHHP